MCGIVGMACNGPATAPMKELFQQMLYHDVVRGPHATGIAAVDTQSKEISIAKAALPSFAFLGTEGCQELFKYQHNYNIYIGHNRWATSGNKDKNENAHPFRHEHIVGVHNGSLTNQRLLEDHQFFEVDSDNIFYHMANNGLDNTLEHLDGTYALVWYDANDNTLNFIRNDQRPMCIAKLSGGAYVWASEMGMLRWLIKRHKFFSFEKTDGLNDPKIKEDFCYNLQPNRHYKIPFVGRQSRAPHLIEKKVHTFNVQSRSWSGNGYEDWSDYLRQEREDNQTVPRRTNAPTNTGGQVAAPFVSRTPSAMMQRLSSRLCENSFVEVTLKEIVEEPVYVAAAARTDKRKRYIFEYKCWPNDLRESVILFNMGYDTFTGALRDKDIGQTMYGRISNVYEASGATFAPSINKVEGAPSNMLGLVVNISDLTFIKPKSYFSQRIDSKAQEKVDDGAEDNTDGGSDPDTPDPSVTSDRPTLKLTKKQQRQLKAQERLSIRKQVAQSHGGKQEETPPVKAGNVVKANFTGIVQLKNCSIPRLEMLRLSEENHYRCAECAKHLGKVPLNQLYLITEEDLKVQIGDGLHHYMMCSQKCYEGIKEFVKDDAENTRYHEGLYKKEDSK